MGVLLGAKPDPGTSSALLLFSNLDPSVCSSLAHVPHHPAGEETVYTVHSLDFLP